MRIHFFFAIFLIFDLAAKAQTPQPLNLMPQPVSVQQGTGRLIVDPAFSVVVTGKSDARLRRAAERFLSNLRRQTGMTLLDMRVAKLPPASLVIDVDAVSKASQALGEDESYELTVNETRAKLHATTTLGALHGLQTILQLIANTPAGFAIPAVAIQDKPRFPWRGLMIDVSRHFMPVDAIKRNLDGMEAVKLNVFHWHLSDDQGFRVESKQYPRLQQLGSDGLYYTQNEIRDVIAYARDRGIRVIPEFDIPGHTTAMLAAYPQLASGPGPFQIERKWGVFNPALDPTKETTYKFLDGFLGEMAKLFPDKFFHIGGDEVNGKQWNASPGIRAFKRAHHFNSNDELQAYFNKRVEKILTKYGKTMVGWDEIYSPNLPKNIVIQSWRGQKSLGEVTQAGFRGILSNGYYLDLLWPASRHYVVDPFVGPVELTPEQEKHVLGAEACMWSEYVSAENLDARIWPRMAAIAERYWSPQNVDDVASMYQRLEEISKRLDWLGLTHNSSYALMLRRIAGTDDFSALKTLADIVEPTKDYTRRKTAPVEPTSLLPLNRLIDAAHPESDEARHFSVLVDTYLAMPTNTEVKNEIKQMLERWQNNSTAIQSLPQSLLMQEVLPVSQQLSAIAGSGLTALDYLDRKEQAPTDWQSQQLILLNRAVHPGAQVILMVVPPVQKLVEAAGKAALSTANW